MAEQAHTTPTSTPHVTAGTTRRRSLCAAASAVVIGSGITAGAAASVADLVESDDAHLVSLCTRYVEADLRHAELCSQQDAMVQPLTPALECEWRRLDGLVLDAGIIMLDLEPRIAAIPAVSTAGIQAKAWAVARMSRYYKESNGASLLRSLLTDLMPPGQSVPRGRA